MMEVSGADKEVKSQAKPTAPSHSAAVLQLAAAKLGKGSAAHNVVWTVICLGVCCGFVVHLVSLIDRYQAYPVNTEFKEKLTAYEFPDVTLCPKDVASWSYGNFGLFGPYSAPGVDRGVRDMIYDVARFIHQMQMDDWNVTVPSNPYSSYRDAKLALHKVAYRTKQFPEPHDIVIFCKFNSAKCSHVNFTVLRDEEHFQCITFTPQNRTVIRAGRGKGLQIMFYMYTQTFLTNEEEIDFVSGLEVYLHSQGEKPSSLSVSLVAPLKYKTEVMLETSVETKVNRDAYPCVQSLPNVTYVTDHSQLNSTKQSVTQSFVGTEHDCVIRKMQAEYLRECGCLATHLPMPADLYWQSDGICHDLHEHFMFRDIYYLEPSSDYRYYTIKNDSGVAYPLREYMRERWSDYNISLVRLQCYHRVQHRQQTDGVDTSECPVLCKKRKYKMTARKTNWPRSIGDAKVSLPTFFTAALNDLKARNLSILDLEELNKYISAEMSNRMGVLDLYPRDLSVAISSEDWAYPLKNFFSDLGGILGLWIGASIVSLFELIESTLGLSSMLFKGGSVGTSVQPAADVPQPANNESRDAAETGPRQLTVIELSEIDGDGLAIDGAEDRGE